MLSLTKTENKVQVLSPTIPERQRISKLGSEVNNSPGYKTLKLLRTQTAPSVPYTVQSPVPYTVQILGTTHIKSSNPAVWQQWQEAQICDELKSTRRVPFKFRCAEVKGYTIDSIFWEASHIETDNRVKMEGPQWHLKGREDCLPLIYYEVTIKVERSELIRRKWYYYIYLPNYKTWCRLPNLII